VQVGVVGLALDRQIEDRQTGVGPPVVAIEIAQRNPGRRAPRIIHDRPSIVVVGPPWIPGLGLVTEQARLRRPGQRARATDQARASGAPWVTPAGTRASFGSNDAGP